MGDRAVRGVGNGSREARMEYVEEQLTEQKLHAQRLEHCAVMQYERSRRLPEGNRSRAAAEADDPAGVRREGFSACWTPLDGAP